MTKLIFVKLQMPGFHKWKDASQDISYLKYEHRHLFYFNMGFEVTDSNREIEFMQIQKQITFALKEQYWCANRNGLLFGEMSCEMVCEFLLKQFPNAYYAEVSEDDENGAMVWQR